MSSTCIPYGYLLPALAASWMAGLAALRRAGLAPEWCRKLLHMGCGSLALTLPWGVDSAPAVLALCAFATLMLAGVKCLPSWNRKLGGVMDGVGRGHRGGFYFAAAIGLVFAAAGDNRLLFCLPVAVLTFADAAAALAGRRWGSHRYPAGGAARRWRARPPFSSWRSSARSRAGRAFDAGGPALTLPVAVLVSLLLTFVEAVCGARDRQPAHPGGRPRWRCGPTWGAPPRWPPST